MSIPKKPSEPLLVRVFIEEINAQKCVVVNPNDTVKAAQVITLEKIAKTEKEPENYGLYLPSSHGRPGKFLDEERLLTDYALQGHVPQLELRYKSRDFINVPGMTERQISKANTKVNQKKFVELVATNALRKVEKALATGIDANFITEDGNTPLGIACGRFGNPSMILTLVSGGTHIDFCGKDGLLSIHRAAIGGNAKAIKTLLSLGASPNSKDSKSLTPLYHAVIMGDHPEVCETLLKDYAMVNMRDQHQWTELHHACKYGYAKHVDLLLKFKADISAKNNVGNTPLHVAASHGQVECAMLLLKRGADKQILNNAGQPPNQVAILCGHHQLSSAILRFSDSEIERITQLPNYNPHAKRVKRPSVATSHSISSPSTPTPSSIAQALLNSAVEDEQKKTEDSNSVCGTPKQVRSVSDMHSGRPSSAPQLQKSHSVSGATRPTPKINSPGVGIPRDIYITRGPQGYGFAMRGIKVPTSTFKPTPEIPAFQFVGSIDRNGSADKASLKEGDYLIEANGHNIITSTHDEVVNIIVNSGKKLHLKVVTPAIKPTGLPGLPVINETPKAIKQHPQQKGTATPPQQKGTGIPPRHSSSPVTHGIPNKPSPPPQVSQVAKNSTSVRPSTPSQSSDGSISPASPQDSVFKFQKTEPLYEEQSKSTKKFPLVKANTVDVSSASQSDMFGSQFREENIRPPSQFNVPVEISRNSAEDENLSTFAIELRKASKAREERILTNQPRMLTATNRQEHNESEEEESVAVRTQAQVSGNPITSSTIIKQENKTDTTSDEVESVSIPNSVDNKEMQGKDSPQNMVSSKKVPVTNLIKQFSGELSNTQEATRLTHTDVEKTCKNLNKQHPSHNMASTNTEMKGKSVTMMAKAFEGERADDGTYNWRGSLRSVSKPSVVESSIPNVEGENEPTNSYERSTNRQIQDSSLTKKPSKTSLIAKKFEQNVMVKSEITVSKKTEKQSLPEATTEKTKQAPLPEQKSLPLVEDPSKPISSSENANSPTGRDSNDENDTFPELPRRQSGVVIVEEDGINFPGEYKRNSVSVDTDYWNSKSPEHVTNLTALSEGVQGQLHDETTDTEILPEPELDILPPPIIPMDEELALSIEDLPLPEFLPPPEIDDFHEFQDLPPPPTNFPDSDFCQEIPSFDITASSNTKNTDTFELPSPSQLPPPHYDTDDFELPSPFQISSPYDTSNFELPSPSQLPPHNDLDDNFELPSPPQLPPHDDTDDNFELPSPSQLPPLDDTGNFELSSPPHLPPPEEGPSDRDDSNLAAKFLDEESALEDKKDENSTNNNETSNKEKLQYSPLLSSTTQPSGKITDSNSMPSHVHNTHDDVTLQTPSDIPIPKGEEIMLSINPDQHLSSATTHDNHELKPSDDISQDNAYETKPVMEWTVDDVCSWLDKIGLEEHIEMFWDNEIQGSHLIDMTKDDLKELGITRLGHRMTITNGIAALLK